MTSEHTHKQSKVGPLPDTQMRTHTHTHTHTHRDTQTHTYEHTQTDIVLALSCTKMVHFTNVECQPYNISMHSQTDVTICAPQKQVHLNSPTLITHTCP